MGFVPDYEFDLFISYAHVDNEPDLEGERGWIDQFHEVLSRRLHKWLGVEPSCFKDDVELKGNVYFEDEIPRSLRRTAVLVSVISPRYTLSDWCLKEVRIFCAEAKGGYRLGNESRVLKVIKLPVGDHEGKLPSALQHVPAYQFYENPKRPLELSPALSHDQKVKFFLRVNELALDIKALLLKLHPGDAAVLRPVALPTGITIYLAETTPDLADARDQMRRELEQAGHTVLPDVPLPYGAELRDRVGEQLRRARLSIHLVGAEYGQAQAGESIVELQHTLALGQSRGTGLMRVIWIPREVVVSDFRQRAFIESLRTDERVLTGAQLLEATLDDLKTTVRDILQKSPASAAQPSAPAVPDGHPLVYLICDEQDRKAVEPIRRYLFEHGCEVRMPARDGDLHHQQKEYLLLCDAALIYSGCSDEKWLAHSLTELDKAPGYGRSIPFRAVAILLGPPDKQFKKDLLTHVMVIDQASGLSPSALDPFLAKLSKERYR